MLGVTMANTKDTKIPVEWVENKLDIICQLKPKTLK